MSRTNKGEVRFEKSKLHIGKINPTLGAIRVVTMILVVITILFLALKIGTRKRNVENLTLEYTNSIGIDYQYFDNYIDRDFLKNSVSSSWRATK